MSSTPRKVHPYAHAAQLPEGDAQVRFDELMPGVGPVELEIGPGRGVFIAERVVADPSVRVIAFEIRLKWAHLVDQRPRAHQPCAGARDLDFRADDRTLGITLSVGVSHDEGGETLFFDAMLEAAEDALLEAQQGGGNRSVIKSPGAA